MELPLLATRFLCPYLGEALESFPESVVPDGPASPRILTSPAVLRGNTRIFVYPSRNLPKYKGRVSDYHSLTLDCLRSGCRTG